MTGRMLEIGSGLYEEISTWEIWRGDVGGLTERRGRHLWPPRTELAVDEVLKRSRSKRRRAGGEGVVVRGR